MLIFAFSLIGIFLLLLWLNAHTPLLGDDITYTYIFNSTEKIHTLNDIFTSQYQHYYLWGGRIVVHTIAQFMLMLGPVVMDLLNALGFILLILLIYLHINYKRGFSVSLFLIIFFLLWFLQPFGETILWITGSANYMWGTILILAFLLPFRIYSGKKARTSVLILQIIFMFFAGVIAGWTNENVAAGMLVIILSFMVYYRKSMKWNIPLWVYAGLLGAVIGYMFMIIAPGNSVRAEGTNNSLFMIVYRLFRHTQALFNQLGLLNLGFVVLLYISIKQKKSEYKQIIALSFIYIIGMLAAVYAMLLSPAFPDRAWFGVIVFNIIAVGILLTNITIPIVKYIKYGFVVLGIFLFTLNLFDICKDVGRVEHIITGREKQLQECLERGDKEIVFEKYYTLTKYALSDPVYYVPMIYELYGIKVKYKD